VPTERSHHIDIQHFAIQDWKESGAIVMEFISGVINPSDDLTKPNPWDVYCTTAMPGASWGTTNLCLFLLFDLLKTSTCVRSIT